MSGQTLRGPHEHHGEPRLGQDHLHSLLVAWPGTFAVRGVASLYGFRQPGHTVNARKFSPDTIACTAHRGSDGTVANARYLYGDVAPTAVPMVHFVGLHVL